jgi:broad-specificity NMP kinase
MQVIVIHGAPGCGKTTTASKLNELYKSPWFEFGWIPEFRHLNPHTEMSFKDEEEMTFETLMLVVKNYIRHGFENIILSDLNDIRLLQIPDEFKDFDYIIFTLYSDDDDVIKERILNRDNGNEYKNYNAAILLNTNIKRRMKLPNEYMIRSDDKTPDEVIREITAILAVHKNVSDFKKTDYKREDYYSYTEN